MGKKTEEILKKLGYDTTGPLAGADPEEIYRRDCALRGYKTDRRRLYVYRCAVYFAEHKKRDSERLKWWTHSDENIKKQS